MKKIQYSALFACGFTLCSCFGGSTSVERVIDNPTANEIVIAIDGKELVIPANSKTSYTFEYGKHSLAYNNQTINFVVKPAKFSGSGFINPTQSNYMFHTFIYATDNTTDEAYDKMYEKTLNKVTVILNGKKEEIEYPVKVVNDVFIEDEHNRWDYNIDEEMPEEVSERINSNQAYQVRKTKVYRQHEYMNYLKEDGLEDDISFPNEPVKLTEIDQYVFPTINLDGIKCEPGKKYLAETLDNWQQLFTLKGNDFASKYEELGGDKGRVELRNSQKLCPKEVDPEQTYYPAFRQLDQILDQTRDIHFYIIK